MTTTLHPDTGEFPAIDATTTVLLARLDRDARGVAVLRPHDDPGQVLVLAGARLSPAAIANLARPMLDPGEHARLRAQLDLGAEDLDSP